MGWRYFNLTLVLLSIADYSQKSMSICQYNEDCPPEGLSDRLNRVCINPCLEDSCGDGGGWCQSSHGQPAAGSPSSPGPAAGGVIRRNRMGWRDWRRNDPTLLNSLWKSKTPLGNAELYIVLALLIGLVTVVIGCWLSDNCWSPEPELLTTLA